MKISIGAEIGEVVACECISRKNPVDGDTRSLFSTDGDRITPHLNHYLIAPLEIFTENELKRFRERVNTR